MKRMIRAVVGICILLSISVTGFASKAQGPDRQDSGDSADIGKQQAEIRVDYTSDGANGTGIYSSAVIDGNAEIATSAGITVMARGIKMDGLSLVVELFYPANTQRWAWFSQCMADVGAEIMPFTVYFEDRDGNRVTPEGTIEITLKGLGEYTDPLVCRLTDDEGKSYPEVTVTGSILKFMAAGDGYYIVAESLKPSETDASESVETEPETGETVPGESVPDETKPGASETDETRPGTSEPGETKPGVPESGENKPGTSETDETKPGVPESGGNKPGSQTPGGNSTKTGDDAPLEILWGLIVISGAALVMFGKQTLKK